MKFTDLNLHESLLSGIESAGYVECTPVQERVLQVALEGKDLYVQSQTGTGKTAAFLIAIAQEMLSRGGMEGKTALIMAPTRELAVQIEAEARTLLSGTKFTCASFYGGVGYDSQVSKLGKGVDIMVGTPGRVIDLSDSRQMDLSTVAFLIIDEADRMFDMGFYPDLRVLIKKLPQSGERQTMLFSATLNTYVKNLAWEYTADAEEITIESENVTVDEIDQFMYHVASADKMKLLLGILRRDNPESVIIFCNTKKTCEIVAKRLRINGVENEFIIGDLPQSKRLQVLTSFKAGALKALIATDVAARGIDVTDLSMVVNYDLPNETENYVHRIGRTARAGKSGKAYTFCSEQDVYNLVPIERFIDMQIPSAMADTELFVEDKSEGIYIKLDTYDDYEEDGRGRGRRGDARDSRGQREGGQRRDGGQRRERAPSDRAAKPDKPKRERRERGDSAPHQRQQRARPQGGPREDFFDDKMLGLPFDERLKKYKEKYASSAARAAAQSGPMPRAAGGKGARKDYSPRGDGRKRAGQPPAGPSGGNGQRPQRRDRKMPQKSPPRQQQEAPQKPAQQQQPQKQPPARSGILQKIVGLFKKE